MPSDTSADSRQTNMGSSDTDDDIIISSALLITATLNKSRGNINQHARRKQTIDQSQLGDRAINCRRIETILSSNIVA